MAEWQKWKHITKLDPDRPISEKTIKTIVDSGTDAIMISGTQRITKDKVEKICSMVNGYDIPKVIEPANPASVVWNGIDYVFVPCIFNTNNPVWINGLHKMWVKFDKQIDWNKVVPEAYIILNPRCSAARLTKAKKIEKEDVVAAAVCAEKYFNFPVIYIEYSGTYGDPEIVAAVKKNLTKAHLFYGGGIDSAEKAAEMSKYATIIVGNTIYENGTKSLPKTVKGSLRFFSQRIHIPEKIKFDKEKFTKRFKIKKGQKEKPQEIKS